LSFFTPSLLRCNIDSACGAFTYNVETRICFLKKECLKLLKDRSRSDISGVVIGNVHRPAAGTETTTETTVEEEEAILDASLKNWKEKTATVKDSPLGGSYVRIRLAEPAVVRCMQFVVPPKLKAQFPQAARIQFSSDNGTSWKTAQALEPIGQEALLVKTLSKYPDESLAIPPGAQPPFSSTSDHQKSLSEAVAAAMKATKEANADKGWNILPLPLLCLLLDLEGVERGDEGGGAQILIESL
jgi:hypothetical protein